MERLQLFAQRIIGALPSPLLFFFILVLVLLVVGAARTARYALLGSSALNPYKHMRHRHRANAHWRPARNDLVRRLLYFATGRRVTTDFLAPITEWLALGLLALAALPSPVAKGVLDLLRDLKNDPLAYIVVLSGTYLMQDTLKNVVSGLELTTTHVSVTHAPPKYAPGAAIAP